ncbi:MAG TPA: Clp protease N-terminal domain-containing protein [Puia sp.]|jgi:ATP-dependent Clp protease ATP-binding subunit ClpC
MSLTFSNKMKEIISISRDEAERLGNDYIGTEHLLLALLREGDNTALRILKSFKVDIAEMQKEIELAVKSDKSHQNSMPLNVSAEQAIHGAATEAKTLKSKRVEPEHLILSILNNSSTAPTILDHIRHG